MQEASIPPQTLQSDRVMLALTVLLHLALPAALIGWEVFDALRTGGSDAFAAVLPGMLQGFGVVVAISVGLMALAGMLFFLLAPGGLAERSR